VSAVKTFKSLRLERKSIECQVGSSLCCSVFLSVNLDFYTSVDVIHSVGMPVGNTHKCSFIVSLGFTGLISSTNWVWLPKQLNPAYGVSINLNFGQ
jgi:hypothetical protein